MKGFLLLAVVTILLQGIFAATFEESKVKAIANFKALIINEKNKNSLAITNVLAMHTKLMADIPATENSLIARNKALDEKIPANVATEPAIVKAKAAVSKYVTNVTSEARITFRANADAVKIVIDSLPPAEDAAITQILNTFNGMIAAATTAHSIKTAISHITNSFNIFKSANITTSTANSIRSHICDSHGMFEQNMYYQILEAGISGCTQPTLGRMIHPIMSTDFLIKSYSEATNLILTDYENCINGLATSPNTFDCFDNLVSKLLASANDINYTNRVYNVKNLSEIYSNQTKTCLSQIKGQCDAIRTGYMWNLALCP